MTGAKILAPNVLIGPIDGSLHGYVEGLIDLKFLKYRTDTHPATNPHTYLDNILEKDGQIEDLI